MMYICLCLISFFGLPLTAETNTPSMIDKTENSPLLNEDNFVIFYGFSEEKLEESLKLAMIKSLEKIGNVHTADDKALSEKQKKDKYKMGGGVLKIVATPVIEENPSISQKKYQTLPVLELSLEVTGGVESLSNKSQFCCPIWKKQKFIRSNIEKEELLQKAVKSLESILDSFIIDYQKANPGKKPEFFLYA